MNSKIIVSILSLTVATSTLLANHHGGAKDNLPVTSSEQKALTPEAVLADLKAGNKRFLKEKHTSPNASARVTAATKGQYPKAYVLSCVDSRVPVEMVFDQGIGDIFVGRVAGNVENEDQLGSMEFASAVAGVKAIVVMGHEACGAVKGACDGVELGNLTMLLEKIAPAVHSVEGFAEGKRNSKNSKFVDAVVKANVQRTVNDLRARSTVLSQLEKDGKIAIVGAHYALADGSVTFFED
jgi:carbonic anhydrase